MEIIRDQGLRAFSRKFASYLHNKITLKIFLIYEKELTETMETAKPRVDVEIRILERPDELDELLKNYRFGEYLEKIKKNLRSDLNLLCAFVEKDLVHTCWIAKSEEGKMLIDDVPYFIDYRNEVCVCGAETVPKYRNLGIFSFCSALLHNYLREKGYRKIKFSVERGHVIQERYQSKIGSRVIGKAVLIRIFSLKLWKTTLPRLPSKNSFQE
jgi:hypothetical protein